MGKGEEMARAPARARPQLCFRFREVGPTLLRWISCGSNLHITLTANDQFCVRAMLAVSYFLPSIGRGWAISSNDVALLPISSKVVACELLTRRGRGSGATGERIR